MNDIEKVVQSEWRKRLERINQIDVVAWQADKYYDYILARSFFASLEQDASWNETTRQWTLEDMEKAWAYIIDHRSQWVQDVHDDFNTDRFMPELIESHWKNYLASLDRENAKKRFLAQTPEQIKNWLILAVSFSIRSYLPSNINYYAGR
ncbi:hypothetical protein HY639_02240 [Candidatus Woesearchaeota archaeon]|nr:hypothetical protein [Candidatus Woesearchaeota archaeon]